MVLAEKSRLAAPASDNAVTRRRRVSMIGIEDPLASVRKARGQGAGAAVPHKRMCPRRASRSTPARRMIAKRGGRVHSPAREVALPRSRSVLPGCLNLASRASRASRRKALTACFLVHTLIRVKCVFDPAKDTSNREKHGVSLGEAERLDWNHVLAKPDTRTD